MVVLENQSRSFPLSSMICKAATQTTSSTRPIRSMGSLLSADSRLLYNCQEAQAANMAIGTLLENSQGPLQLSEIQPPSRGPAMGDRQSVVVGESVSVRFDHDGLHIL